MFARLFGRGAHRLVPPLPAPAIGAVADQHARQVDPTEPAEMTDADRDHRDMADPEARPIRLRERARCSLIIGPHVGSPLFAAAKHIAFATDMQAASASDVLGAVALPPVSATAEEPPPRGYRVQRYGASLIEEN